MDPQKIKSGWKTQEEFSYWVPDCDIEGTIPKNLHGTFIRNGPGLDEVYGKKLKHAIDGDGMVCKVSIIDGEVHFCSKFVNSEHRKEETKQRKFIFPGQMGTRDNNKFRDTLGAFKSLATGQKSSLIFRNPSNTNAFYWGGKILALYETHLPHALDPYTLQTLGLDDLGGKLKLGNCSVHFRIDPKTMRLVLFSLRPGLHKKPSLVIYEFDEKWNLTKEQNYRIPFLNYAHDFLLFPDYYMFHISPFTDVSLVGALKILGGWTSPGESMKHFSHLPSQFVVIPRNAQSEAEIIKIDTGRFHIFHYGTCQQKYKTKLNFNAVCMDERFNMSFKNYWLSNMDVSPGHLFQFDLDLEKVKDMQFPYMAVRHFSLPYTGLAWLYIEVRHQNILQQGGNESGSYKQLDTCCAEFPTTHPYRNGVRGTRHNYLMASDRTEPLPFRDVVKIDTVTLKKTVWYSDGIIGEPVFIPRYGYDSVHLGEEDDGFVIVQLYHTESHKTHFCILDAQKIEAGPVARIKLHHHVPYGFHGTFTPEVFLHQRLPQQPVKSKL